MPCKASPKGTHQAPVGGSCESVLVLSGSCSVLRRKDGHTCTCLSTLLLMSSKVDMAATWKEHICLSTVLSLHGLRVAKGPGACYHPTLFWVPGGALWSL